MQSLRSKKNPLIVITTEEEPVGNRGREKHEAPLAATAADQGEDAMEEENID